MLSSHWRRSLSFRTQESQWNVVFTLGYGRVSGFVLHMMQTEEEEDRWRLHEEDAGNRCGSAVCFQSVFLRDLKTFENVIRCVVVLQIAADCFCLVCAVGINTSELWDLSSQSFIFFYFFNDACRSLHFCMYWFLQNINKRFSLKESFFTY